MNETKTCYDIIESLFVPSQSTMKWHNRNKGNDKNGNILIYWTLKKNCLTSLFINEIAQLEK